jgi:hypothetical protein
MQHQHDGDVNVNMTVHPPGLSGCFPRLTRKQPSRREGVLEKTGRNVSGTPGTPATVVYRPARTFNNL